MAFTDELVRRRTGSTESLRMLGNVKRHPGSNALEVMEQADALFTVSYPEVQFRSQSDEMVTPLVGTGVNAGMPLNKYVVRDDTDEVLGLHSGTFPQSGSYEFLGSMAEQMFPNSTTSCVVFDRGERIALTQDIGESVDLGGGDVIKPQLIWTSSFNGQWATKVHDLVNRLFCTNQLISSTALFSVKHTKFHDITFSQRANILRSAIERAEVVATQAQVLKDQEFTDQMFKELTQQLVPLPPKQPEEEWHTRTVNLVENKRNAMVAKWNEECEHWTPGGWGNKWLAYNAVQGAEQHQINAQFASGEVARQRSLTKALDGKAPLADRALSLLLA